VTIFVESSAQPVNFDGRQADILDAFNGEEFLSADGLFRIGKVGTSELSTLFGHNAEFAQPRSVREKFTTYNFEVNDFHTYIAGGIRVHNTSILDHVPDDAIILDVDFDSNNTPIETAYLRPDGVYVTLSGQNINGDGTIVLNGTYEYNDGTAQINYTDTYDADGNLLDRDLEEIEFNDDVVQFENIGNIIGTQLGSYWFDDNIVEGIAASTLLGTITQNLAETIQDGWYASVTNGTNADGGVNTNGTALSTNPLEDAFNDAFSDFGVDLVENLQGQVIGLASSLLLAELAQELGLEGFEAGILTSGLGSVTNTFINNIADVATGVDGAGLLNGLDFSSIAGNIANGVAGYFGSQLANDILDPETQEAALFSSIGSAIGSYIGSLVIPFPVLGTFIGSFIGTLIGGSLGDLFGDEPEPPVGAGSVFLSTDEQMLVSSGGSVLNGGNLEYIEQLLEAHANTFNTFIENAGILTDDYRLQIGGSTDYSVNFDTGEISVVTNSVGGSFNQTFENIGRFTTAVEAIDFGLVDQITQTYIVGGDALVNIVLQNSQATSLQSLMIDIQTAQDYRFYLENTEFINDLIAAEPDSAIAQQWTLVLIRALALGLPEGTGIHRDTGISELFNLNEGLDLSNFLVIDMDTDNIILLDEAGTEVAVLENVVGEGVISQVGTSSNDTIALENGNDEQIIVSSGLGGTVFQTIDSNRNLVTYNAGTGNDHVTGDTGIDIIQGEAGDDTILGGAGGDFLSGGQGDDTITGGAGADVIVGGLGDDIINIETTSDGPGPLQYDAIHYSYGDGFDTINSSTNDHLFADLHLLGISLDSVMLDMFTVTTVSGTSSTTTHNFSLSYTNSVGDSIGSISFQSHYDYTFFIHIDGLTFNLTSASENIFIGGQQIDVLDNWHAGTSNNDLMDFRVYDQLGISFAALTDYVFSGIGDDQIYGGNGNDILLGQAGHDIIYAGNHRDTVRGGDGNDQVFGETGDDILEGNTGDDHLNGGDGDDLLSGGDGSDVLFGGAGADYLDGGEGIDTVSYDDSNMAVTVSLEVGTIGVGGHADGDIIERISNLTGSTHGDSLTGNSSNNVISGLGGNDTITGGLGNDTVDAGAGNDRVIATQADGNDTYTGGAGFDILDFSQVQGVVQINQIGGTITGSSGNDTLNDVFEQIIGSNFDDALSGGNGGDVLDGNDGNDRFFGNGGTDLMRGGNGNDTFFFSTNDGNDRLEGGAGFDVLDYSSLGGRVQVNQLAGTTTGTANNDTLLDVFEAVIGSNFGDVLSGGNGINVLNGGGGDDQLFANGGNDLTSGGEGNDTITLGLGDDRHDFRNGEDIDTITDFNAGAGSQDQIILRFHSAATSFAQMQAAGMFSQQGANTLIELGNGDQIILNNVNVDDLHQDDFVF